MDKILFIKILYTLPFVIVGLFVSILAVEEKALKNSTKYLVYKPLVVLFIISISLFFIELLYLIWME